MIKGLVTVVVPIYNTEKYLDRCISSIVNQTYRNLEILLIDDGSPDSCPEKCDMWALRDSRIRVIHKENEGQGIARNIGIENSSGEYIYFVDSDDYIAHDTIEKAYGVAVKEQAEIVVFGFSSVDLNGCIRSTFIPEKVPTFRGKSVQEIFLPDMIAPDPKGDGKRRFYMSACMTLFSMHLIQNVNWRFVSEREIVSEETYSMMELLYYAESAAVFSEPLYFYCENVASFSRKYTSGRYKKIVFFYESCLELCDRLGYGETVKQRLSKPFVDFTLAILKQTMGSKQKKYTRVQEISEIIRDSMLRQVLDEYKKNRINWKQKAIFWTIRHNKLLLCCTFLVVQNMLDHGLMKR